MAHAVTEAATFALALIQNQANKLAGERLVKCVSAVAHFAAELHVLLTRYGAYDKTMDYAFDLPARALKKLSYLPMPAPTGHGVHAEVLA